MNYLDFILKGFNEREKVNDLIRYFYSEGAKFEDEFICEDFFYQCRQSLKPIDLEINKVINEEKKQLFLLKSIHKDDKKLIESFDKELEDVEENHMISTGSFSSYIINIGKQGILSIQFSLDEAEKKLKLRSKDNAKNKMNEFIQTIESTKRNTKYSDLLLNEFLDTITARKIEYQLNIGKDTITGTKSELINSIKELSLNNEQEIIKQLEDKKEYYNDFELNQIEIFNYLEKITGGFDNEKSKLTLKEIDCYYHMDFLDRIDFESQLIYDSNNWEIPYYLIETEQFGKTQFPDLKKMRAKTHPFDSWNIDYAMKVLNEKLNNDSTPSTGIKSITLKETPQEKDKRYNSRIFIDYESFLFFVHQVNYFDSKPDNVTDYSYLFVKMKGNYIHKETTNKEFINHMNEFFNTELTQLKSIDLKTENNRNNKFKLGNIQYNQNQ